MTSSNAIDGNPRDVMCTFMLSAENNEVAFDNALSSDSVSSVILEDILMPEMLDSSWRRRRSNIFSMCVIVTELMGTLAISASPFLNLFRLWSENDCTVICVIRTSILTICRLSI